MRNGVLLLAGLLIAVGFAFNARPAAAQTAPTCEVVAQDLLASLGTTCANLDRGTACYGAEPLTSVFFPDVTPEPEFAAAGDRVELANLVRLGAGTLTRDPAEWGLGLLALDANYHVNSFPNGLVGVVFGPVEVESGVFAENIVTLTDQPVTTTTSAAAELRSAPDLDGFPSIVVGQVGANTSVSVDAVSADGAWARIQTSAVPSAWIAAASLNAADFAGLPVITPERQTPFESFFIRYPETDASPCTPPLTGVLLQGPRDSNTIVTVQGETLLIESTVFARLLPVGSSNPTTLEITVLSGLMRIRVGTPDETLVPAGFVIQLALAPTPSSLGVEGDADEQAVDPNRAPFTIRPLTQAELTLFALLGQLPSNLINYVINLPVLVTPSGIGQPLAQLIFSNPQDVAAAQAACAAGQIPANVCEVLGF